MNLNQRILQVRKYFLKKNLDAVLISSVPNIIYLTNFTHFMTMEREAFLIITPKSQYIITDKRYTHAVQTYVKNFKLREISYMHGFGEWMKKIAREEQIQTLGIEEDNITVKELKKIEPAVKQIKDFDLNDIRLYKDENEIKAIQTACEIGDKTFTYIRKALRVGMTENEIAHLMEQYIKKQNATLAFDTIVAIQEDGAFIHHKTGDKKLEKNNCILFDFGVNYNNYCSDMSRTIFFGNASAEQKKAYAVVKEAQTKAVQYIEKQLEKKEKISGAEADKTAREYIIEQCYESFPHGLGHGIGLEVHEEPGLRPPSKSLLTNGMVFSIEPGIYILGEFGIRIEDLYTIQNNKLIQLTNAPK